MVSDTVSSRGGEWTHQLVESRCRDGAEEMGDEADSENDQQ